ncbi:IGF-like family receptor 1 [Takifugu flavidus]|uniref:IGF-like family receptor 1 n=1 Tax=Takifugu flavidus TaxID=433684 RepID=A0A5C6PHV7_9TELE|nr:IGF-like family receptor 1 [Takifugu flavidus]
MQRVRYSQNCPDLGTRWNPNVSKCVPCDFKPGGCSNPGRYPGAPERGADLSFLSLQDIESRRTAATMMREGNMSFTFSRAQTALSTTAAAPAVTRARCAPPASLRSPPAPPPPTPGARRPLCLVCVRRKRALSVGKGLFGRKRLRTTEAGFEVNGTEEDTLDSAIVSAPIQTVLNDLDVLEDLMILLDPETQGVKNTKHLASHCGFSSTWITYAYSMRDCKSPLKAVLEGITSRQPDWTVGDLVKMLRLMERNDAIAMLSRLRPDGTNVCSV